MEIDSIQTNNIEVDGNPSSAGINDNIIINGDFDIWQRGTSFDINAVSEYTADRWFCDSGSVGSSGTFSRRAFSVGQTNVPGEPQYNIRFTSTTAVGTCAFIYPVEDVRRIADRTMTLSFYCYGSIAMSGCSIGIYNIYDGSAAEYVFNSSTFDVGTSWSKKIITFTTPSISGKTIGSNSCTRIYIRFNPVDGETANLSHVKLEEGSVATPFVKRPITQELTLCKRYFEKSVGIDDILGSGTIGCNVALIPMEDSVVRVAPYSGGYFTVEKRTIPTITIYDRDGDTAKINKYNSSTTTETVSNIVGTSVIIPFSRLDTSTFTAGYFFECNWKADAEL